MSEYKEIIRFEEFGKLRRFLYKDDDDKLYNEFSGKVAPYGLIKFFARPYVDPDKMVTVYAKAISAWCEKWVGVHVNN